MTAADVALEQLAADALELQEANRQLIDLVADLAWENHCLRGTFSRLLRVLDDARLTAQRERDAVLEARSTEAA